MSSFPAISRIQFWPLFLATLLVGLQPNTSSAQSRNSGEGEVHLTNWPTPEARRNLEHNILPFIEWMTVRYDYDAAGGRPALRLQLEWRPESHAIYEGKRTPVERIPGVMHIVAADLRADVYVEGLKAAELAVVVDSMILGPHPDRIEINLPALEWSNVFLETSAEEAQLIFERGFELRDLDLANAAFAVMVEEFVVTESGQAGRDSGTEKASRRRPTADENRGGVSRRPTCVSVYRGYGTVDVVFDLFWLVGSGGHRLPPSVSGTARQTAGRGGLGRSRSRAGRASADRTGSRSGRASADAEGARSGRGSTERSDVGSDDSEQDGEAGERDGKRKASGMRLPGKTEDDDDDDDDDTKLVPYAVAAVAAAGILAAAGGTVGYYGSSRHAPYGLTSGFVRPDGGLLLQVGVNEALIFGDPQPKRLLVKLLSFGNLLNSRLQPALGAGVLATSEGGAITYEPSVSFGGVGRFGMLILYGGYDFWQQGPEFGAALNFRELRWRKSGEK